MNWTQQDAPLMDALKEHLMNRVVRFDVPGHKGCLLYTSPSPRD